MKFEHTFVFERDGKMVNANLENHDISEARAAMESHKANKVNSGCMNYWVRASNRTPRT